MNESLCENKCCCECLSEDGRVLVGYFWKGLALFLLGVIVGFIFAPIKKGVKIGNNNGNHNSFEGNETEVFSGDAKKKKKEKE